MALTLIEASKSTQDVLQQAVVEVYARTSDILRVLPFKDVPGGAYKYNQEGLLPGIGFRGINEGYTESTGVLNPMVEPLVIAGGDLDVDKAIIKMNGPDTRTSQEMMKVKALAHRWTNAFVKGDSSALSKEFDGLQVRLTGSQLVAAGSTAGGDALSLAKLDELIDAVDSPTHLLMTKAVKRLLSAAARNPSVSGYIQYTKDAFGRPVMTYNDLPILIADGSGDVYASLAFNEANPGGGSNVGTSIYCLSLGDGMLSGLQNGDPEVTDLGELEGKPSLRTRVEWLSGVCFEHPRCAARLWGVKNAAVVA